MKLPTFSSDGKPLAALRSAVSPNRSRTAFWYSRLEMRRSGVGPTWFWSSDVHEAIACGPGPGGGGTTPPPAPPIPTSPPPPVPVDDAAHLASARRGERQAQHEPESTISEAKHCGSRVGRTRGAHNGPAGRESRHGTSGKTRRLTARSARRRPHSSTGSIESAVAPGRVAPVHGFDSDALLGLQRDHRRVRRPGPRRRRRRRPCRARFAP